MDVMDDIANDETYFSDDSGVGEAVSLSYDHGSTVIEDYALMDTKQTWRRKRRDKRATVVWPRINTKGKHRSHSKGLHIHPQSEHHKQCESCSVHHFSPCVGPAMRLRKYQTKPRELPSNKKKPETPLCTRKKRVDWAPGIIPRALALNLGYAIGEDIANSRSGLRDTGILALIVVLVEFLLEFVWTIRHTSGGFGIIGVGTATTNKPVSCATNSIHAIDIGSPQNDDRTQQISVKQDNISAWQTERARHRVERLLIIVRYFAITAIVSAFNGVLKGAIYDGSVASIIELVSIIFVVANTAEEFSW